MGSQRIGHKWATFTFSSSFHRTSSVKPPRSLQLTAIPSPSNKRLLTQWLQCEQQCGAVVLVHQEVLLTFLFSVWRVNLSLSLPAHWQLAIKLLPLGRSHVSSSISSQSSLRMRKSQSSHGLDSKIQTHKPPQWEGRMNEMSVLPCALYLQFSLHCEAAGIL